MKNIKKVLAVMTAVSAFAASSSAFAETTYKATAGVDKTDMFTFAEAVYDGTTSELETGNTITVNKVPGGALSGEMTLLVLDHDANLTNVADGDILYIDQGTYTAASGETAATNPEFVGKALGLKVADLLKAVDTSKEGVYYYPIKVGYYTTPTEDDPDGFAIADGKIVVTVSKDAEGGEDKVTITFKWGDIDADGVTDSVDADALLSAYVGGNRVFESKVDDYTLTWGTNEVLNNTTNKTYTMTFKWGDIDADGVTDSVDADALLSAYVGGNRAFESKVDSNTYNWSTDATFSLTEKNN